ncbi:hypothetical protein P308_24395 [Pseudomonas piscis]|nr:hypothetical protein P308_24395 [Pseudomonas piscis]
MHQVDQVIALGDQAFQFQLRVALLEGIQAAFEAIGLVGIGKGYGEPRLDALGQLAGGQFQAAGGGEDLLGAAQQHLSGRSQAGLAAGAVEQLDIEVDLQAGHCGADGRLALAELARGGGERTLGRGLDECQQHFVGCHEVSPWSMVIG